MGDSNEPARKKSGLEAVAATLSDPQYKAGRKLIDDGRLEEAVNFFSGLLETRVAVLDGDETNPALAPLYYEYGNSLLYNAEESGAVFGDAITEAEKQSAMALVEASMSATTQASGEGTHSGASVAQAGEGDTAAPGEDASVPTPGQDAEEDLEIAWENLEMARRIYSELELTEEVRTSIAKVHLRLGDLSMVNGMYNEAAEDFEKCLEHRLALPVPQQSRGVADAHVRRAQALFYASTLEGADKDVLVARSLEQYRMAANVFETMLASHTERATASISPGKENTGGSATDSASPICGDSDGKGKGKGKARKEGGGDKQEAEAPAPSGSAEELEDVLDSIRETIETMVSGKDMEALAEYKSGASSTTIGFGGASSAAGGPTSDKAPSNGTTTVGFGSSAATSTEFGDAAASKGLGSAQASAAFSSSGAGAKSAPANVMVVKRKGRPAPKPAPNGVGLAEGGSASTADDLSKRPKVDK